MLPTFVDVSGFAMRMGARLVVNADEVTHTGLEQMPESGPVVLAVRHYHHLLDGLGLLAHSDRPLHIMIGLDWVRTPTTRWLMESLARGCAWPVTLRTSDDQDSDHRHSDGKPGFAGASAYLPHEIRPYQNRAYRQCVDLLRRERVVVMFPESFPVIDPHTVRKPRLETLAPFKSGFARAAVTAARRYGRPVAVVPVGIRAEAAQPRRLAFSYGKPRLVTGATDIDSLIAQIRADVCSLSQ